MRPITSLGVLAFVFTMLITLGITSPASAELKKETVTYKQGDTELRGYLVTDPSIKEKRPAVLVVHDWFGIGEYSKMRAEEVAKLGYTAMAVDIYGGGKLAGSTDEAGKLAGSFKGDRKLLRARIVAAFDHLKTVPGVDASRIACIGYCFGGTTSLELARSGAPVAGVVSFHGGLDSPTPEDAKAIKCKVLVCHGAVDPFVSPEEIAGFQKEMNDAKVDYQFIAYSGAVHSFTHQGADKLNIPGAKYQENADKRSWQHMKDFFAEIFAKK